ncbi:MAG TPA: alpha-(1-_3)-arabinofuranosyltransferase family protein [Flexivirga sp.]|uniref:alpha-(1->3)-arabinofuranosyltransferase domain-containing protein n=1 Tax=Flexivirga sp. TaxID=1962927 RepID=UPI002C2BA666|nr:alpha-(1->3)-arabinofuranosyltransferase family protein [Flexivirga sp.]HWC21945.1 alpha-(1->3)-arabinofuranosyltransferase family protein [Flexivirga sp.]
MRRQLTGHRLTVFGLTLLLALIVALNGLGHFYTDIKPEVYLAPRRMIEQYLSAWTDTPYLGSANFNVGLVPVLLVTGALRGIGLSPEWTFKVVHFVLWLATAWGTARLTRRLIHIHHEDADTRGSGSPRSIGATQERRTSWGEQWAGLAAGVLILANPYTIQAGSTLAIALPMALLPWSLLAFIRALWTPGDRWFSPRGWAWPAVFGLLFFAMSGMNVAIVPIFQLLALLPILWVARRVWRLRWPVVLGALGKCTAFVVGVSIYWLVPGFGAMATGNQIIDESESLTGIAKVASFPEVLRGMGLWSLYGQDNHGAWVPQDAVFLTSPTVMALTMLWPALALLAMRWLHGAARVIVGGTVAISAVLMVGMFPAAGHPSSPFGVVFHWFVDLPGMAAFRTTNKVGALLALAFAIALGVAAAKVLPRLLSRDGLAPLAAVSVLLLLVSWTLPALTNRLYTSPMDIPSYWKQAAKAIDKGDPGSAVLFLPGQTRPAYRWTVDRPDDVANSLFNRQVILPETSPNASAPGGNFLASLDSTLQNALLPDGTVSTYARYLGADTVLMRHDTNWEDAGGVRPGVVSSIAAGDKGLRGVANYGLPGEFVRSPDSSGDESQLPPLQRYAVKGAGSSVRVERTSNSLVVAGDGWSVPAMVGADLLGGSPSFRYAQDLSPRQLAGSLGGDHALVLTDTNERRNAVPNRLASNQGPLLAADQKLRVSRTLGDNPQDQTVLERSGPRVTATSQGGAFFDLPYAVPENAVDGDPSTAWLFGDFNRAPGNRLTITEPTTEKLGTIRIAQARVGKVKIDKVTVRAGGKTVTRRVPSTGYADFPMGNASGRRVTVTIDSTRGHGYNLVGLSDIQLPGPAAVRAARTPLTFDNLYQRLNASERARFDRTPLNVLLTRQQGTADTDDDAQTQLRRVISLPDARTFAGTAAVRVAGDFEPIYDRVAGLSPSVSATSSDFYFRVAGTRASLAADGKTSTAWQPGGQLDGAWWQLDGPERDITSVSVTQRPADGDESNPRNAYAKRVTFTVDGKKVATAALTRDGTTRIAIPQMNGQAVRGKKIRMTIDSITGSKSGTPPRFTTIDTGLQVKHRDLGPIEDAGASDPRCIQVATVDGWPVQMRPTTKALQGTADQGGKWTMCGTLDLGKGTHRIEPVNGFTLDNLYLKDTRRAAAEATHPQQSARVTDDSSTHKTLQVRTTGPSAVVLGQSIADGWHATANGKDLGAPQTFDGYSAGWALPKAGKYTVHITYSPQVRANIALGVSIVVILLAVALVVVAFVGKVRRPGRREDQDGDSDDGEADEGTPSEEAAAAAEGSAEHTSGMTDTWERRPRPKRSAAGAGPRRLTTRIAPLHVPRMALEIGLVLVAGFFVGWAGLVAGAAVVAALRWRRALPTWWFQLAGAALLLIAMGVYLLVLGDTRGTLSADGVARSMWPHWLAGAGLVIGLVGVLRGGGHDEGMTDGD